MTDISKYCEIKSVEIALGYDDITTPESEVNTYLQSGWELITIVTSQRYSSVFNGSFTITHAILGRLARSSADIQMLTEENSVDTETTPTEQILNMSIDDFFSKERLEFCGHNPSFVRERLLNCIANGLRWSIGDEEPHKSRYEVIVRDILTLPLRKWRRVKNMGDGKTLKAMREALDSVGINLK
jgi:hypothetical protein